MTAQTLKDEILRALRHYRGVDIEQATKQDVYFATARVIHNRLSDIWSQTQKKIVKGETKAVGYLSAEFLLGKQLANAVLNAGLQDEYEQALNELGYSVEEVEHVEYEPSLGNGGLGRLAACYVDSLATLGVPSFGYGIRYRYGLFRQKFDENGAQTEKPDYWLQNGDPWGVANYSRTLFVGFGGAVSTDGSGRKKWTPAWQVKALPYDYLVPGYRNGTVNTLRLWESRAINGFDLNLYNQSRYDDAIKVETRAQNISKVLYPEDSTYVGKELRLEQQYFFAAASVADAISTFYPGQEHPDLTTLPEKIVFQLNDTHPVIAIAELMRLLIDVYGYEWDTAWAITRQCFNYTCHTLLPEALEVWPANLLGSLLPRHLEIIKEIDNWFRHEVMVRTNDMAMVNAMAIYSRGQDSQSSSIRMAYLATAVSEHVNGVAELHSELLKESVLKDFNDVFPQKFTNVTNGVTPRRFIKLANPRLSDLITEGLGTDTWITDLDKLEGLDALAKDDAFVDRFAEVKKANKRDFTAWAKERYDIDIDPNSMFDTMIKRLHEYKRQSLKILQVIALYSDIKNGNIDVNTFVPRTVVFGAKSAPGYVLAKETIKLINNVSRVINSDPEVQGKLKVIFPPNYNVAVASHIIPATDLDEQISQAGEEASGTSNMKFAMNGALTVGTLDGANIEIRNKVGADNFFLFGMTVEEVQALQDHYNPRDIYESDPQLKAAIDMISSGTFSPADGDHFEGFVDNIVNQDRFMALADFRSYMDIQSSIESEFRNEHEWARKALLNVAHSGYFSSDRSIKDYLDRVWFTGALPKD